ncbi:hypothetical protein [Neolewinella sp.]|uniref:hypothetical protein n=1 Tax=Neolewinella sp. TaxID=2993543 RepID=UPI003B5275BD
MVEALINATVASLRRPENRENGITSAILKFLQPAFAEHKEEFEQLRADPGDADSSRLVHLRLDGYLTGEPDRIEELEDILDREDGV